MSGILFFIFASCEPLSQLTKVNQKAVGNKETQLTKLKGYLKNSRRLMNPNSFKGTTPICDRVKSTILSHFNASGALLEIGKHACKC